MVELLANVFREAGVTEAEITENKTSIKRLAKRLGTTRVEANAINEYRGHLTEAKDSVMVRPNFPPLSPLTWHIAIAPSICRQMGPRYAGK